MNNISSEQVCIQSVRRGSSRSRYTSEQDKHASDMDLTVAAVKIGKQDKGKCGRGGCIVVDKILYY
ncbi:hypothetical protein PR048_018169 [Dryococelus australis]|uniref:Uncharacterized protein n=1 Tax=Dryococelus australis TaxID=614101 RepID=A0ABQ9HBJ0_9NEOP|nr:hypothetical protein PR048_018169 [Dryococelus australis]